MPKSTSISKKLLKKTLSDCLPDLSKPGPLQLILDMDPDYLQQRTVEVLRDSMGHPKAYQLTNLRTAMQMLLLATLKLNNSDGIHTQTTQGSRRSRSKDPAGDSGVPADAPVAR